VFNIGQLGQFETASKAAWARERKGVVITVTSAFSNFQATNRGNRNSIPLV
jgi:hypothetical protein